MMWLLIVIAILSICFGSIVVFDADKSAIIAVSKLSVAAGEYLENCLTDIANKNRGYDLIYFGITWLALAYLGLKTNKTGIKKIKPFVG